MSYLHGKFVWFEHASGDIAKARGFYEPLLGWHTEAMPVGDQRYHMILNNNQGIGGYGTVQPGERSRWMCYLSVADVDASFAAAQSIGARGLTPPMNFGPVGRGAQLADPTGAAFWLWKGAEGDRPDAEQTPAGDWFWNELWTPDESRALNFYERLAGYQHDTMDMGPQGTYYILKAGDKARGGLMRSVEPKAPPMWLPYVAVDDCDGTAAKARSLGGQVVSAPEDIPEVGRFAIIVDPLGAAIGVIKPLRR
jgi:predicted enzyme related to lactoylglutathione lyase